MTEKPECFSFFPHKVPPMMDDCYKNCKYSIILCKQATAKKETVESQKKQEEKQ